MYLPRERLRQLLEKIASLIGSRASRLWIDHFSERFLEMESPEVRDFLAAMKRLGEPFVTGFRQVESLSALWKSEATASASEIVNVSEPVHSEYFFSVLRLHTPLNQRS